MKRKYFAGILVLLISCLFVGCASTAVETGVETGVPAESGEVFLEEVNQLDGLFLVAVEGTVSTTEITVCMRNETEHSYFYGTEYDLQKLVDGAWYSVPYIIDNYGFPAVELCLEPGEAGEKIDWESFHGAMEQGSYRIVKSVYKEGNYSNRHYLAAEFTIT